MKTLIGPIVLLCCCSSSLRGAGDERVRLTWNAPKIRELEREMDDLFATFTEPSTKITYEVRGTKISKLIASRLTPVDMRDLATDADRVLPDRKDQSRLERLVIPDMIWVFLKQGDRKSLVALLSKCCPPNYGFVDIEEFLVIHGDKLKDPIKILPDALAECKRPSTRKAIVAALRRAFEGSGIRGADDDTFVKNAMEWYDRERDKLERNPNYYPPAGFGEPKKPLFWFKDSPEAEAERRQTGPRIPPPMVDRR